MDADWTTKTIAMEHDEAWTGVTWMASVTWHVQGQEPPTCAHVRPIVLMARTGTPDPVGGVLANPSVVSAIHTAFASQEGQPYCPTCQGSVLLTTTITGTQAGAVAMTTPHSPWYCPRCAQPHMDPVRRHTSAHQSLADAHALHAALVGHVFRV